MNEKGLARRENMGSARKLAPSIRTKNVECPIQVRLGSCRRAAGSYATLGAAPALALKLARILRTKNGSVVRSPGRRGGGSRCMVKLERGAWSRVPDPIGGRLP